MKTIICTLLFSISFPLMAETEVERRLALDRFRRIVEAENKKEDEKFRKAQLEESAKNQSSHDSGNAVIYLIIFIGALIAGFRKSE